MRLRKDTATRTTITPAGGSDHPHNQLLRRLCAVLRKSNPRYFVGRRNDAVRPTIKLKRSAVIFGEEISDGKYTALSHSKGV